MRQVSILELTLTGVTVLAGQQDYFLCAKAIRTHLKFERALYWCEIEEDAGTTPSSMGEAQHESANLAVGTIDSKGEVRIQMDPHHCTAANRNSPSRTMAARCGGEAEALRLHFRAKGRVVNPSTHPGGRHRSCQKGLQV